MPEQKSVEGGPPLRDFRNQNSRLLDDIRVRAGIPLGQGFGLDTVPRLQPVFVVNPDAAPLMSLHGCVPVSVAANAGFRSEIAVTLFPDRTLIAEVFVTLYPVAGTAYHLFVSATLAAFTQINSPPFDVRYPPVNPSVVWVGTKNTAAASAGTQVGNTFTPPGTNPIRFGPFYLDGAQQGSPAARNSIILRPAGDNTSVTGMVEWRALQRQPT